MTDPELVIGVPRNSPGEVTDPELVIGVPRNSPGEVTDPELVIGVPRNSPGEVTDPELVIGVPRNSPGEVTHHVDPHDQNDEQGQVTVRVQTVRDTHPNSGRFLHLQEQADHVSALSGTSCKPPMATQETAVCVTMAAMATQETAVCVTQEQDVCLNGTSE